MLRGNRDYTLPAIAYVHKPPLPAPPPPPSPSPLRNCFAATSVPRSCIQPAVAHLLNVWLKGTLPFLFPLRSKNSIPPPSLLLKTAPLPHSPACMSACLTEYSAHILQPSNRCVPAIQMAIAAPDLPFAHLHKCHSWYTHKT